MDASRNMEHGDRWAWMIIKEHFKFPASISRCSWNVNHTNWYVTQQSLANVMINFDKEKLPFWPINFIEEKYGHVCGTCTILHMLKTAQGRSKKALRHPAHSMHYPNTSYPGWRLIQLRAMETCACWRGSGHKWNKARCWRKISMQKHKIGQPEKEDRSNNLHFLFSEGIESALHTEMLQDEFSLFKLEGDWRPPWVRSTDWDNLQFLFEDRASMA